MTGPAVLAKLVAKRLKRLPMNLLLRDLVAWEPREATSEGYSVAIACMHELPAVAIANLEFCSRLAHDRLEELILVFNCPEAQIPAIVTEAARRAPASMRVRLIGYDDRQGRVAARIHWGWVYSWLSWSLAIRAAKTRALIIHDLDALPLHPDFFERLYENWADSGAQFCGIHPYRSAAIGPEMNLLTTFELALDAEYMRRRFRPFDLFNKLRVVDGRVVDFDTMLLAQRESPGRALRPIDESTLVHPSRLICNYTDLVSGRSDLAGLDHALPVLAYFMYLGGDPTPMATARPGLEDQGSRSIALFDRTASIDGIKPESWAWMEKQIRRTEQARFGETRPEVSSYLAGIIRRAGASRTVGHEVGALAVPDR